MTETPLPLSAGFEEASESAWLQAVEKALKGGGLERITRKTRDDIAIRPLYREPDFASATDPRGMPGAAPYLRGGAPEPDRFLPWDIRQPFTHPDPGATNNEILRDLERGVSSIELAVECSGQHGVQLTEAGDFETALAGVRADLATVALDHRGAGTGASAAGLLALWAETQAEPKAQKLAFNIDVLGCLARTGRIAGGLDASFAKAAALTSALALRFPNATSLRADARIIHEAGGSEAQEIAVLIASAVDTIRRLEAAGMSRDMAADQLLFTLSLDGNYGIGIAKLRAARRLWARVQGALDLQVAPMRLQAVSSQRMLTRYDPWVNMLRGTAACFAGAVGGADVISIHPFNSALGQPEELGRRVARNTQIIAMEESGLGRVADPSGGAWFSETLSEDLAQAAWDIFQSIEAKEGYGHALLAGTVQDAVAASRTALEKAVAHRKVAITGVSEFPLLEGVDAPVVEAAPVSAKEGVSDAGLRKLIPDFGANTGDDAIADGLSPMRVAAPFETLRDRAEAFREATGERPAIFLATLGPLAEHTARADFARNLFASGGIEAREPAKPPEDGASLAAAFKDSGCVIAVLCGSDARYEREAAAAAKALKAVGAARVWLAGKFEADDIDSHIAMGCDVLHHVTLAQAELGVK